MIKIFNEFCRTYLEKNIVSMALVGFSCGLPLLLTASTLTFWLQQEGISYTSVGLVGLVALPYSLKWLWAPFIDYLNIPILTKKMGHKRSWLLISQIVLMFSILIISCTDPGKNLFLTILAAIFISTASATQEIIMRAYQAHILKYQQYGHGEAFTMFGYRIGMLISGAGALYLAEYLSWQEVYQIMAFISLVSIITTFIIDEPIFDKKDQSNSHNIELIKHSPHINKLAQHCYKNIIYPFLDFTKHKHCYLIIMIMFSYKLGDNLIGNMANIFYSEMGFSKIEIANASKMFGMLTTISGGFIAGFFIQKIGNLKSLAYTIVIHGLSILLFIVMAKVGKNTYLLYLTVAIEHITGGMRTTALLSLQLTLINRNYAGTQLALFNSVSHFSRTLFSSASGWLIDQFGWVLFFIFCSSSTIISLVFVLRFLLLNNHSNENKLHKK